MRSLLKACEAPGYPARVLCVVSDNPEAEGLEYAKGQSVPVHCVDYRKFQNKNKAEKALLDIIFSYDVNCICLAGFMRVLSKFFLDQTRECDVLNIHPSLLPKYKGLNVHERVIKNGEKKSGCTVHYVSEKIDGGDVILQKQVPVFPKDTPCDLAQRVLEKEHEAYPQALRIVAEKHRYIC